MKNALSSFVSWFSIVLVLTTVLLVSTIAVGEQLDLGRLASTVWVDGKKDDVVKRASEKKATIFQFWASWCVGCKENMVSLSAMESRDLGFLSVSIDEKIEDASSYFKVKKIPEDLAIWDKDMTFSKQANVTSVPYFVVVSSSSEVLFKYSGHVTEQTKKDLVSKLAHGESVGK